MTGHFYTGEVSAPGRQGGTSLHRRLHSSPTERTNKINDLQGFAGRYYFYYASNYASLVIDGCCQYWVYSTNIFCFTRVLFRPSGTSVQLHLTLLPQHPVGG